ncbi:alpha/beta fold hydrolase [Micromonospora sp. DT31]|uniref:alpha/beta fold hydrolase n=1 Tax=Micromonospora sp. DT31 TaxID=3393434 RepID=UPI003CF8D1E2
MPFVTVGTENSAPVDLYYEDHGSGQPIVLIHGFPFNGASWEKVSGSLLDAGYRVITYDRRGFGNSAQPATGYDYDTFAADLDVLVSELDLRNAILVGHSMGTGEVTRYLGAYGSDRVDRAVLIAPLAPYLLQTPDNPEGVEQSLFDGFKQAILADRFAYLTDFCDAFFDAGGKRERSVSDQAYHAHWQIGTQASARGTHDSVDAWLTDFRGDLPNIDVPVLIIQGTADAVLPYPKTGQRLVNMLPDARLVTLTGAPHGVPWTHAGEVTRTVLDFIGAPRMATA